MSETLYRYTKDGRVPIPEEEAQGIRAEWADYERQREPADVQEARETLRRLERELCDGCEAVMEHIGPERLPEAQRTRLEAKRAARATIQEHEEKRNDR